MKFILSALLIAMNYLTLLAQPFEGKITFGISFPSITDPQTKAMLPTEAVSYFKGDDTRMEMNMAMGMKQVTLSNAKTKKSVVLMDMMGQKYAIEADASEDEKAKDMEKNVKVKNTKETKKIAGYTCTKAIVSYPNPENESETTEMILWFTKELEASKAYISGPMSKIEGAVLEFSVDQGQMAMVLTAKEVKKMEVKQEMFEVPSEYKRMTQEELQNMMGGGR